MRRAAIAVGLGATVGALLVPAGASRSAESDYAIAVDAPSELTVASVGRITLVVSPGPGRRISSDGPVQLALSVSPTTGLTLSRRRLRRRHADEPEASNLRFSVAVTATSAGRYEIALDLSFWLCAAKTCRPVRERRQIDVRVPPVDAGPPADT